MNLAHWVAIVNPKARSGKLSKDWQFISEKLSSSGVDFDVKFTEHRYHAVELTIRALRDGYRNIISVGGDGTIHEIVNGIFFQKEVPTSEVTLAVIPAGSGNDWSKMFEVSLNYCDSIKAIGSGKTILQDIGKITYFESGVESVRYMVNIGGVGYDPEVCVNCNNLKERGGEGKMVYLRSALKALFSRSAVAMRVFVDGKLFIEDKIFSIALGIGKYSGGGMMQVPDAIADDGLINLTAIRNLSMFSVMYNFKKLFSGKIYEVKYVSHTMGRVITIETNTSDLVEIDGEVVGETPIKVEVLHKALRVVF